MQAAPAAALSGLQARSQAWRTAKGPMGGRGCSPQVPAAEMLTASAAVRMRPRWGLEGQGMFVFAEAGQCESASPAPTHGAGMAGSPKWLGVPLILGSPFSNPGAGQGCWPGLLPAPRDTGFSTGLAWGSLKNLCARELAPRSPRRHPCRGFSARFWQCQPEGHCRDYCAWSPQPAAGRGTEGPQRGTRERSCKQKPGR